MSERVSDQNDRFVASAHEEIGRALLECPALKVELEKLVSPNGDAKCELVNVLNNQKQLDFVVEHYLYPATKKCLTGLLRKNKEFLKCWDAAREVLAWLCVLSIRDGWEPIEVTKGAADNRRISSWFEIPVATDFGVEILSSHYRRRKVTLPEGPPHTAEIPGRDRFPTPRMPVSFKVDSALDDLLLEIWKKVYPLDKRPANHVLSADELALLKSQLAYRDKHKKNHHYFAFSPKQSTPLADDEFLFALLTKLPNLMVIRMEKPEKNSPLLVSDEHELTTVIRDFLGLRHELEKRP